MVAWQPHVHESARDTVAEEPLLQAVAVGLHDLFSMSWAAVMDRGRSQYLCALLRPNKRAQATLLTDREIACVFAPYTQVEVRSVAALERLMKEKEGRVDPRIGVLVHSDATASDSLRVWGAERNLSLIPIHYSPRTGLAAAEALIRNVGAELYRHDSFALNEPVASDRDFFGRGQDAERLLRSLAQGQVKALFAMRRAGKTSVINRIRLVAQTSSGAAIAMVDASDAAVHGVNAADLDGLIASTIRQARAEGYAVAGAIARTGYEASDELILELSRPSERPVIVVFDEVDSIGPDSRANPSWTQQFVPFWRSLRVAYQESRRQDAAVGVLVCGVSSRAFREIEVNGEENPVYGFVPEEYLAPFAARASERMIKDLGLRCGLQLGADACALIHEECGGFPFWIRLAGSMLHREFDLESRPLALTAEDIKDKLAEFVQGEGGDHAEMTLSNLGDRDPGVLDAALALARGEETSNRSARLVVRYGVAQQRQGGIVIRGLLRRALMRDGFVRKEVTPPPVDAQDVDPALTGEMAVINNRVERDLRTLIRGALQATGSDEPWMEALLRALPEPRRSELAGLGGADLMQALFFLDLKQIIEKHWPLFEKRFGNKRRFTEAMDIANDRPFAHPKDYDLADLALFRREYRWLQTKVDA